VDLLIALSEGTAPAAPTEPQCEHPEEKRQDATTMGGERKFYCKACGQMVPGVA
jgi:hypothetical protein